MEIMFYFLGTGIVMMLIMLMYDGAQSKRMKKVLRDSKNVQPLFLLRAAEQNLRSLNTRIYGTMGTGVNSVPAGRVNMDESARQMIAAELGQLVNSYNSGTLTLQNYNARLGQMLNTIDHAKGLNFERIKY